MSELWATPRSYYYHHHHHDATAAAARSLSTAACPPTADAAGAPSYHYAPAPPIHSHAYTPPHPHAASHIQLQTLAGTGSSTAYHPSASPSSPYSSSARSYRHQVSAFSQPHAGVQLHHPSPVRAHSYPQSYGYGANHTTTPAHAFSLSGFSTSSSVSSHHHRHPHPPSPPLSTSAMPDPWGADRTDDDEWGVNGTTPPNGLPSPRVVPLPPTAPVPYPPSSKHAAALAASKRNAPPGPNVIDVWASLMDLSKGRDKVLKTVQYSLRTYLYVLGLIKAVRPLTKWFRANEKRSRIAVKGLSLTRKCLLLGNPLRPAAALLSPEPTSAREFLDHLIDLVGALADDIFCLSRLGLVSHKRGDAADTWANRIWFFNTVTGLYGQYAKSHRLRDPAEEREDEWRTRKLLCDLVFVSYDIFELSWFREPILCGAGLLAALISTGQLYNKEYKTLAKKMNA